MTSSRPPRSSALSWREHRRNALRSRPSIESNSRRWVAKPERQPPRADRLGAFRQDRAEVVGGAGEHAERRVELIGEAGRRRRVRQRHQLARERDAELRELALEAAVEVARVRLPAGERRGAVDDQAARPVEIGEDARQLLDAHRHVVGLLRARAGDRRRAPRRSRPVSSRFVIVLSSVCGGGSAAQLDDDPRRAPPRQAQRLSRLRRLRPATRLDHVLPRPARATAVSPVTAIDLDRGSRSRCSSTCSKLARRRRSSSAESAGRTVRNSARSLRLDGAFVGVDDAADGGVVAFAGRRRRGPAGAARGVGTWRPAAAVARRTGGSRRRGRWRSTGAAPAG